MIRIKEKLFIFDLFLFSFNCCNNGFLSDRDRELLDREHPAEEHFERGGDEVEISPSERHGSGLSGGVGGVSVYWMLRTVLGEACIFDPLEEHI